MKTDRLVARLPLLIVLNALVCAAIGLAAVLNTARVAQYLVIAPAWVISGGLAHLVLSLASARVARLPERSRRDVMPLGIGNMALAVLCLLVFIADLIAPGLVGMFVIVGLAIIILVIGDLIYIASRGLPATRAR